MSNDEKCTWHPDRRGVRKIVTAKGKTWMCDECSADYDKEKENG